MVGLSTISRACGRVQKGLGTGLDGGIEPMGQRGRDKNMGTKCTKAPEMDIYGGWKPRQVCWFGDYGWTDRYLKRLWSSVWVCTQAQGCGAGVSLLLACCLPRLVGYVSSFVCGEGRERGIGLSSLTLDFMSCFSI